MFSIFLSVGAVSAGQAKTLSRLDFFVKGSSCAACLIRIEKKLRQAPGVLKATVSIYRPHAAVVIFEPKKLTRADILKILSLEKTSADSLIEEQIKEMPLLITPKLH